MQTAPPQPPANQPTPDDAPTPPIPPLRTIIAAALNRLLTLVNDEEAHDETARRAADSLLRYSVLRAPPPRNGPSFDPHNPDDDGGGDNTGDLIYKITQLINDGVLHAVLDDPPPLSSRATDPRALDGSKIHPGTT